MTKPLSGPGKDGPTPSQCVYNPDEVGQSRFPDWMPALHYRGRRYR